MAVVTVTRLVTVTVSFHSHRNGHSHANLHSCSCYYSHSSHHITTIIAETLIDSIIVTAIILVTNEVAISGVPYYSLYNCKIIITSCLLEGWPFPVYPSALDSCNEQK